jgi:hypothetical protein
MPPNNRISFLKQERARSRHVYAWFHYNLTCIYVYVCALLSKNARELYTLPLGVLT